MATNPPAEDPSPRRRILLAMPAAALALAALWSLGVQLGEQRRAPDEADWEAARDVVREHFREGDVIRNAPHWADAARDGLFGYPINVAVDLEEPELYLYDRLWILADTEYERSAREALPPGWAVVERWETSPRTRVLLVDIPPPTHVLFDAVSAIEEAEVVRDFGDRREPCTVFHRGGWHCDRFNPWLHVTPSHEEVGNSVRRCLYLGIPPAELQITWRDLEMGARLEGRIGNTMPAVRASRGSDIDFRVAIDGQAVHELRVGKWDQTFHPFTVETAHLQGRHDLTLALHAEDFFDRWVCLQARILR